jgi:hypothetical protein
LPPALLAVLDGDMAARMTDTLADVYAEAFAAPPHNEPPEAADRFRESLARHTRLPGFPAALAWAAGADLVGFGYGHTSLPGQWWHDRAAAALVPEARGWLEEPFVVIDLAVRPRCGARGSAEACSTSWSIGRRTRGPCSRPAGMTRAHGGCTMLVAGRRSGATSPSSPAAIRT